MNVSDRVPLYRAIQKLSSHHRFILQLLKYASSAEGQADLPRITVHATKVVAVPVDVAFPSIPQVENIIRPLLPPGDTLQAEMDAVRAGFNHEFDPLELDAAESVPFKAFVHCECSLIADFTTMGNPQPFRYIGVSKLSCAACHLWIKAFNNTHHTQYHTRGTHGRWYPKWAMPTSLQTQSFLDNMIDAVQDAYKAHSSADKTRAIELSDSTEAKGSLLDITITTEQRQRRLTLTRSDRAARLGKQRSLPPPTSKSLWIVDEKPVADKVLHE